MILNHLTPFGYRCPMCNSRMVIVLLAVLLSAACRDESAGIQSQTPKLEAGTLVIESQMAPVHAMVPGAVISLKRAAISSHLIAYVRRVDVQAGDAVLAGQHLLSIDSSEVQGNLQRAQADVNQAQAVYDETDSNYKRYSTLFPQGAVSRMQLDAAQRQYDTARAQLQSAQAALRMASAETGYADVVAPFAGVVVEKLADAGDLATPGKPLLVVEDEHALEVQSYVPDDVYNALRVGQEISFSTDQARYKGLLQSIVSAADAQTHTHLIRLSIPAQSTLTSGLYVRVQVPVGQQALIRVPTSALAERAGIVGVFVVDGDGRARFRLVRVGNTDGDQAEILSGLTSGDRIVVQPDAQIDNGTLIADANEKLG